MSTIKLYICSYVDNKKLCISTPTIGKIALEEKDALSGYSLFGELNYFKIWQVLASKL